MTDQDTRQTDWHAAAARDTHSRYGPDADEVRRRVMRHGPRPAGSRVCTRPSPPSPSRGAVGLPMAVIYIPCMNPVFHTQPLTADALAIRFTLPLIVLLAGETGKWLVRHFGLDHIGGVQHLEGST